MKLTIPGWTTVDEATIYDVVDTRISEAIKVRIYVTYFFFSYFLVTSKYLSSKV